MLNIKTEPVFVALVSSTCNPCKLLLNGWDVLTNTLVKNYPKLRFPNHTQETKKYKYPPVMIHNNTINSIFPKDLNNYLHWYPIMLLIDGNEWDKGMSNKDYIFDKVQIMNSQVINNKVTYLRIKNENNPEDIVSWVKDTSEVFKKTELNMSNTNPVSYIAPIIKKIKEEDICKNTLGLISRK